MYTHNQTTVLQISYIITWVKSYILTDTIDILFHVNISKGKAKIKASSISFYFVKVVQKLVISQWETKSHTLYENYGKPALTELTIYNKPWVSYEFILPGIRKSQLDWILSYWLQCWNGMILCWVYCLVNSQFYPKYTAQNQQIICYQVLKLLKRA